MATIMLWDRWPARRFASVLDGSTVADPGLAVLLQIATALRVTGAALRAPEEFRGTLRGRLLAAA